MKGLYFALNTFMQRYLLEMIITFGCMWSCCNQKYSLLLLIILFYILVPKELTELTFKNKLKSYQEIKYIKVVKKIKNIIKIKLFLKEKLTKILVILFLIGLFQTYCFSYTHLFVKPFYLVGLNVPRGAKLTIEKDLKIEDNYVAFQTTINGEKVDCFYFINNFNNTENNKTNNKERDSLNFYHNLKYGDVLNVYVKEVEPIRNQFQNKSSFDFEKYKLGQRVTKTYILSKINKIDHKIKISFILRNIRLILINNLNRYPTIKPYISSLVYGDKSFDKTTKESLKLLGLIQLFTISGFHLNLLYEMLAKILKRALLPSWCQKSVLLFFLTTYYIVGGEGIPLLRACLTKIIIILFKKRELPNFNINILIFLFLALLIINPLNLHLLSFNFSFLFTFFLYLNQTLFNDNATKVNSTKVNSSKGISFEKNSVKLNSRKGNIVNSIRNVALNKNNSLKYKLLKGNIGKDFINSYFFSFYLNLLFLPLITTLNFRINILYPLLSYVYEYIIKSFLILSLIVIFLTLNNQSLFIFEILPIVELFNLLIIVMKYIFSFNFLFVFQINFNKYFIFIYYLIIFSLYKSFYKIRIYNNIKKFEGFKKRLKRKYISLFLLLIVMTCSFNFKTEVNIIDIGQGDSTLITTPFNNQVILIDTGPPKAENEIKHYLNAKGIKKIDFLIITHHHDDHYGNIESLLQNFKVKNIVLSKFYPTNTIEVGSNFKSRNIQLILVGEKVQLNNKLTIYGPKEKSENENNNSLVVKYVNKKSILIMGDAEEELEKELISKYTKELKSNYLKVGHHGSKTSTTQILLDNVRPEVALISCGYKNKFKHPSEETLEILNNNDIEFLITSKDGEISLTI